MECLTLLGLVNIPLSVLVGYLASRKNRSFGGWFLFSLLCTFLVALLFLAFRPFLCPDCPQSLKNAEWKRRECPRCGSFVS